MVQRVIYETSQVLREISGFASAALVLVAVSLNLGIHAAVFSEADGEDLRLIADRGDARSSSDGADPMERMRSRLSCAEKIPGFTVILGLSRYNVELSVPVSGMLPTFEQARRDVARSLAEKALPPAA